jgi:urease accessory protein
MLLAEPALIPIAIAHQRVNGAARIEFALADGRTRLSDLYQRAPCRVLFPDTDRGEPVQAVLLTTSGGLTGGDRIQVDFVANAGTCATLTSQAAEKLYRALPGGGDAQIAVRVEVGKSAYAEYLAQETIVFDGARLRRNLDIDLAADARLLAVESIVFGRRAMHETLRYGFIHDVWRIRRGGRLVFADTLRLDGDLAALRAAPFGFGDAVACGTLIYAANDAPAMLDIVRAALQPHAAVAFATTRGRLLIVRLLAADAVELRRAIITAVGTIRQTAAGLSTRLPQVWYC